MGGQAVSSLLECRSDAHWEELDWKINDSGKSQKDVAVAESQSTLGHCGEVGHWAMCL